ncbi:MAG: hypothetical protein IKN26_00300 [Eubacterium sp.]|nr:hypothetical protein [Eubacterium sp.]
MKNFIKKHISLLLAAVITISAAALSIIAFAVDNVELSEENFPDENFRNAVAFMYDINKDGILSAQERNTDSMIVSGIVEMYAFENDLDEDEIKINNLKGIEYFESLRILRCSSIGHIESLDLSGLDELEILACNDLGLKSINLSNDLSLKTINICSNDFQSLDFSENKNLERIHCYENEELTSVNINSLDKLQDFRCDNCALTTLDLSTNTGLKELNCSYNELKELDLSNNPLLVSDGRSITEYNIGFQKTSAKATASEGMIVVPFETDGSKIAKTSIDKEGRLAFSDGYFFTDDFDNIKDGLTYYYNTGISDSALMSVNVDISELAHIFNLFGFDFDKNEAKTKCLICKEEENISFTPAINARQGDNKYNELLDITKDGIINAKDYAAILKEYK